MKKFVFLLFAVISVAVMAENEIKRIAILETVDKEGKVGYGMQLLLRAALSDAVTRTPGYEGYDRVDLKSISGEQSFQRTGMVSDADIKKIGVMTGAQFVLVAEAAVLDAGHMVITAKITDVETARLTNTAFEMMGTASDELKEGCSKLAAALLGVSSSSNAGSRSNYGSSNHSSGNYSSNQDFTEEAWGINMKMIWVEGGEFMMGCTSEQGSCDNDEQNVRRVTLDGFYIGMLEVTQSQWEKVMGTSIYQQKSKANGDRTFGVGPDYPMYFVSWEEADEFCRQLSNKTGRTYTLPTEAQWEYAARGGKKNEGTKYAGSNMVDAVAWYGESSSSGNTHPCGTKRANALGIYDMSGNVWEWCKDWYSSSYTSYDTNNPTGPSSGSIRVNRGGGWNYSAGYCRVAYRNNYSPGDRNSDLGFRVVLLP